MSERRLVDINAVAEESLNLAWHGARAEKQGFNITLERSLDPGAGETDVFPQKLLNLISNGFYAATKRKAEVNGGDPLPRLGWNASAIVADPDLHPVPEVLGRGCKCWLVIVFFTTKPAGEGTGLGLSISHRTHQHLMKGPYHPPRGGASG